MPRLAAVIVCMFLGCAAVAPAQEFGPVPPDSTQAPPRPLYTPPVKVTFQFGLWGCVAGEQRGDDRANTMVSADIGLQFFPKHRTVLGLGFYSESDDVGVHSGFKLSIRRWLNETPGHGFYVQLAPALLVSGQDDHRQIEKPVYHLDGEIGHSHYGAIAVGSTWFDWTTYRHGAVTASGQETSTYIGIRGNRWFAPGLIAALCLAASLAE